MNAKAMLALLFIFLFLSVPAAVSASQEVSFNLSATSDFDSGFKSNSSNVYEVETAVNNPAVHENELRLADKRGSSFTFETENVTTWKVLMEPVSQGLYSEIKNSSLILNASSRSKTVSVELTSKIGGNFSVQTEIPEWKFYDPYGEKEENESDSEDECKNPAEQVIPVLECVEHHTNGTYTAHFRYDNKNENCTVLISIGENNRFSGQVDSWNAGQPEYFSPGKTNDNFSVYFERGAVIWFLRSPNGDASTVVASSNPVQMCRGDKQITSSSETRKLFSNSLISIPNNLASMVKVSSFISLAAYIPIFPPPNPAEISDYLTGLVFEEGSRKYVYISHNRTHIQMEAKSGFTTIDTDVLIYPEKISNGDALLLKLERENDTFFGYYKIENSSWNLIGNISNTGLDGFGKIRFIYLSPKRADGPGAVFSNYLIQNAKFQEPSEIYRTSGTWVSSELHVPNEMKLLETSFNYSGDYSNFISSVEWVDAVNSDVLAKYSYDFVKGNNLTIRNSNLTFGSFNNITNSFKIRINFSGNGSSTPVLREVSGKYRLINTPPAVEILTENNSITNSKNISLVFKVIDLEQNNMTAVLIVNDENTSKISNVVNNTNTTISTSVPLGKHWYWIEADDGDLTGTSLRYTFEVINNPPEIYIETENNTFTSNKTPEIFFSISDKENETLSAELFFNRSSMALNTSILNNTLSSLIPNESLNLGKYNFWIKAYDGVNYSVSSNYSITIHSVPELEMLTANNTSTYSENITLSFKIVDSYTSLFDTYLFVRGENITTHSIPEVENNTITNYELGNLSEGQYQYWFKINDGKMNHTYQNYTFTIRRSAPSIEVLTKDITAEKLPVNIEFILTDEYSEILSAILFLNGSGINFNESIKNNTVSLLLIPEDLNLTPGNYSYWIEAGNFRNYANSSIFSLAITAVDENETEDNSSSENDEGSADSGRGGGGGGFGGIGVVSPEEPDEETEEDEPEENDEPIESEEEPLITEQNSSEEEQTGKTPTGLLISFVSGRAFLFVLIIGLISLAGGFYFFKIRNSSF